MKEIIEVFRMIELSPKIRTSIIIKIGRLVNDEHGANITEPLVYELVKILEPENPILSDEHYMRMAKI